MPAPGRPQSITPEVDEFDELVSVQERYYYSVHDKIASEERDEDRRELVRIPTCAVFHKFASGKGVPHSFVGFIRQWPALPEVVVSLRDSRCLVLKDCWLINSP
jgi:KUP system potassium uptake protein